MDDYFGIIFLIAIGGFIFWANKVDNKSGYPKIGRSELILMSSLYLYSEISRLERRLENRDIDEHDRAETEKELKQANYRLKQINYETKEEDRRRHFG